MKMQIIKRKVIFLLLLFPSCIWCRCFQQFPLQNDGRNGIEDKNFKIVKVENNLNLEDTISNSQKLDNMLEKAVLKIMTGNLTKGDIQLLKSLNYSSKEIFGIREQQSKRENHAEMHRRRKTKTFNSNGSQTLNNTLFVFAKSSLERSRINESKESDFEEYNRQAVYDYENMFAEVEIEESDLKSSVDKELKKDTDQSTTFQDIYQSVNKIMKSQMTLKQRYDDPEFNSFSNEKTQSSTNNIRVGDNSKHKNSENNFIVSKGSCKSFQEHNSSIIDLCSLVYLLHILKNNTSDSSNDINLSLNSQEFSQENHVKEVLLKISTLISSNFKNETQNMSNNSFGNSNWMDKSVQETVNSEDSSDKYYNINDQNIKTICRQYENFYSKIISREIINHFSKEENVS